MTVKHLFLIFVLIAALSVEASAGITVIVQPKSGVSLDAVLTSLGATLLDVMPDGSSYLLSVPAFPTTIPATVDSISIDSPVKLPRFAGSVITAANGAGVLPWYADQPAMQLINA